MENSSRKRAREEMECQCIWGAYCEVHPPELLLQYMDEAIMKVKEIMNAGYQDTLFTNEEKMKYYLAVYTLTSDKDQGITYAPELCKKFEGALEESITSVVLPSLADEDHVSFLKKLLTHWSNYKKMAQHLSRFFEYLDRYYLPRSRGTTLLEISLNLFCTLVCDALWERLQNAVIRLINQERQGQQIHRDLLKGVIRDFVMDIDKQIRTNYYNELEQVILTYTLARYSQLASRWLSRETFSTYVQKVEWCLNREKRAGYYLLETTMVMLLEDLRRLLLDEIPTEYIVQLVSRG